MRSPSSSARSSCRRGRRSRSARAPTSATARSAGAGRPCGYYVLLVGMMVVGVYLPFVDGGVRLANCGLFAIVAAELVNSVVALMSYRRGWHG
ncbi:hypothetical protein [Sphingopyxis sp. PET50]|uniref:hypothetical protein n=1 Tax=Sphingopyxis sp. PET50 TaxID=2976533 RepID=UPI0021AF320C|nr:hypothetical protein [Sphingopyxis sp. PET50]